MEEYTDGHLYVWDFHATQIDSGVSPYSAGEVCFTRTQSNGLTSYKAWANALSAPMNEIVNVAGSAAPSNNFLQWSLGSGNSFVQSTAIVFDRILSGTEADNLYAWLQANKPLT